MMELIEGKKAKENTSFPKNMRQIGEPGEGKKVFIEDYAYTFLRQFAEENLTCVRTAVLVGKTEESAVYIQGALEVDMDQDIKNWFTHEHWRSIFQEVQNCFDGWEVLGWYMSNPGFPAVLTDEIRSVHMRNFAAKDYVFFQSDMIDNEEVFYISAGNGLRPLSGYYIYYEKNERMQNYISQRKGGMGIETEGVLRDRAATRFRNVMQEKKEHGSQKKLVAFLYTISTFLIMIVLVIGITMVNNYERMTDVESAIYLLSESLEEESEASSDKIETLEETQAVQELEILQPMEGTDASEGIEKAEEQEESVQPVMSPAVEEPEAYQIRKGDTLLQISRTRYGTEDMVKTICEINALENGDKIYVGQTILLP